MKPVVVTLLCALVAFTPAVAQQAPVPRPEQVATPEAIITAMYESVKRAPGEQYDWDLLRGLCLPGALLVPSTEQTGGALRTMTVDDFIAWIDQGTTVGGPNDQGFAEEEIAHRIERYGDIAQVFSTYQKHVHGSTEILGRGINSVNLVHNGGRWWIASIIWDEEVGAGPIPRRYLPGGGS
jgi:hypothetical protein